MTHRYRYRMTDKIVRTRAVCILIGSLILLYAILPDIAHFFELKKQTMELFFMFVILVIMGIVYAIRDFRRTIPLYNLNKRNPEIIVDESSIHLQEEKDKKRIQIFFKDIIVIKEFVEADDENTETFFYIVQEVQGETSECFFFKSQMDADEYNSFRDLLLLETKQKSPLINLDEGEQDLSNK